MSGFVFPDTTVLRSFAAVGELPLLRARIGAQGRVTEAVAAEVERQKEIEFGLSLIDARDWFGDPIRIDDPDEIRAVDRMRRHRFGGRATDPLRHLGESETLVVLDREEFATAVWLTDDRDAYRVAENQRITARHTVQVLRACVLAGALSWDDARSIHGLMTRSGRHLLEGVETLESPR